MSFTLTRTSNIVGISSGICNGLAHFPTPTPKEKKLNLKKFLIFSAKTLYPKNFLYFGMRPDLTYCHNYLSYLKNFLLFPPQKSTVAHLPTLNPKQ